MSESDFRECVLIDREMRFYTYDEFCKDCVIIRKLYNKKLGKLGKMFYKWYVYANIHTTTTQKNLIWDYLNSYITKEFLLKR